jgi:hypothetical protein
MRKLLILGIIAALALPLPAASAAVKSGSSCKAAQANSLSKNSDLICQKKGNKWLWVTYKKKNTSSNTPVVNFSDLNAPSSFDFTNGADLKIDFSISAITTFSSPEVSLVFKVDSGKWELPSQEIKLKPTLKTTNIDSKTQKFTATFDLKFGYPIGEWNLEFEPIKFGNNQSLEIPSRKIELSRAFYGGKEATKIMPTEKVEYLSFKSKQVERYAWTGRNIAFQTISKDYDPEVMGRIVFAFDKAYDSYKEITGYTPSILRQYKNLLVITEMSADEVGCGAGCGYLGATGIELQSGLFNRLYNGVKLHDQYEQAPFYELGRNFWNYGTYKVTLLGSGTSAKWFDANTTGFAVFMRFLVMQLNNIPGGPWDNGKGVAWDEFVSGMKKLALIQRDEAGHNFLNTFESARPPYAGPLSVNDFWASVMFYFAPPGGEKAFAKSFFTNLAARPPATNTASGVQNFVNALSLTLGKSVDSEFYETLHFGDARSLVR